MIGFALMALVLFGFQYFSQPSAQQIKEKQKQDSIALVERQVAMRRTQDSVRIAQAEEMAVKNAVMDTTALFYPALKVQAKDVVLQNELVKLTIGAKGGAVKEAILKKYNDQEKQPLKLVGQEDGLLNFDLPYSGGTLSTSRYTFEAINATDSSVTMRLMANEKSYIDFTYKLKANNYMVDFTVQAVGMSQIFLPSTTEAKLQWKQKLRQCERVYKNENHYSNISYNIKEKGVDNLSESKNEDLNLGQELKWVAFKSQYFSQVMIAESGFNSTLLRSRAENEGSGYLKMCIAETKTAFDPTGKKPTKFHLYYGPNHYKTLAAYDKHLSGDQRLDLDELVYLGWPVLRSINQWITINLFDWLSRLGLSMGMVLFLMTLIIKLAVQPLTYKSYLSSSRMRVLKPEIAKLAEKYPRKEDAMKKQQETMAIYSKYGVSPMSGCLPTLLQMPIWMALFMFVPTAIELRQQSFLWANDLSSYDDLIHWSTHIPFLGTHLSLFCLLMTITNILNTKYNMNQQDTGQQQMPGMKMMMYAMPVMFIFVLNDYASGLNYYYFLSGLISILIMVLMRRFIDDDKILAQLQKYADTAKPKKKSSFMQKLEDMQKQQETLQKQRESRLNK